MAFKVQVGPPQIAIHQGQTVLVTDPDGTVTWPSEKGLYFLDTRIISNWAIYANGERWQLLNGGPLTTTRRGFSSPTSRSSPKMDRSHRAPSVLPSVGHSAVVCTRISTSPTTA